MLGNRNVISSYFLHFITSFRGRLAIIRIFDTIEDMKTLRHFHIGRKVNIHLTCALY